MTIALHPTPAPAAPVAGRLHRLAAVVVLAALAVVLVAVLLAPPSIEGPGHGLTGPPSSAQVLSAMHQTGN